MQKYDIYNEQALNNHFSMQKPLHVCGHYQEYVGLFVGHLCILLWSQNSLYSRKATLSLDNKEQKTSKPSGTMK
jgi:hypothetical protein